MKVITFPILHKGQKQIFDRVTDRTVLRCGRRFGKTVFLETRYGRRAIDGKKIGWFTPDYKLMRPTYSRLFKTLFPLVEHASKTEALIELIGGGCIEFWTLDNEDAGRSRDYDDVVIDEASLIKSGLRDIIDQSIAPTLIDRNGTLIMAGTPKGIDADNFFYIACTDKSLGWREFHMPTEMNPRISREAIDNLPLRYPPLVIQQEYMAEFVDWSGDSFFSLDNMLIENRPVNHPISCDVIYAVIDSATKTGKENDGTAVTYFSLDLYSLQPYKLTILDWDIAQIEGAVLVDWLPGVIDRCKQLAIKCGARKGSIGCFVEDKASGMILIQQSQKLGWPVRAIESDLTAVGKVERAISVSGYVFQKQVKIAEEAFSKVVNYKGSTKNHLISQVTGFRPGIKDQIEDDVLDTFCYGVAIGLGNEGGY